MRYLFGFLLCLLAGHRLAAVTGLDAASQLSAVSSTADANAFSFTRLDNGVQLRVAGVTKNVLFYGPSIVRVNANLGRAHTTQPSLVVLPPPVAVPFTLEESADTLTLRGAKLRLVADKKSGALTFFGADGKVLTRERADLPATIKEVTISGEPTYEVSHSFTLAPDESLYGLGQYNRPYMDYRGQEVLLVQTNIGTVVPFLLSTKRYGILWDIYSKMTFKDDATGATLWAESAPAGVDYYFVAGDTMDGVIAGYRTLTGAAPMFPKQAFGLFMSKERYPTQDRLIEVVKNFRREGFPLDYIVQDWQYWGGADGTWSGMTWDQARFPDPAGLTKTLHEELHVKLMNSIWPSVGNDTALARELDAQQLRFAPLHWISKQARIYDAFSAEGRAIYFKHVRNGLLDVGVDALWMDGTEVEVGGACHDPVQVELDIKNLGRNALGDFTRYLNPYTLLTTKGTYEGQRATSDKRVFTLTRSAWAGQQRYAALPWSGDTTASWETLRHQISGGVNLAMAGLPYWTQDTGGFFVNYLQGELNPEYQELYARWNQFGIFNPIYRIHGTSIEREPYLFKTLAPEIYRSLLGAAQLRYALLPYIYSLAWQSTANSYTMMRGLPLDFPDDPKVRRIDDAFMFGPAFLVHPVTRAMYHVSPPPPTTIPAAALQTPDGKPGLAVQYFKGVDFNEPAGATIDEKVEHHWPGPPLADPPPGLAGFDNFSARWEGTVTAPEAGEYEFGVEYDDGARLYLGGHLVADDWSYGAKRYRLAKITLAQGQKLPVKAEFHQGGQELFFRLGWRTPSELRALAAAKPQLDNAVATYLPAGAGWYDFGTHERFAGGQTVTKACPLDTFPVYVRAGSIVPMGPADLQYATERPAAPYTIRIYPGANARFALYEDDNETYAYERGQRATVELVWDEVEKTLRIGARHGTFPGMVATRELKIELVGAGPNASQTVVYRGEPLSVAFDRFPVTAAGANPIFRDIFTADPAALVVGDTVYAYVGHDAAKPGEFFVMPEWRCYSSQDLKRWTPHGVVMRPEEFKFARANVAWASHVVAKDGRYFLYATLRRIDSNEHCIGVAVADRPTGPFKDARGTPLITDGMTTDSRRPNADIDPAVFIDDDGTAWLVWGNGDFYLARFKPNMTELDGPIRQIPTENIAEGPWLFKRGQLYYNVYAADVPGTQPEQIAYATAPAVEGPWTYRGLVTGPAKTGFTIHPAVIEFKGQWYFFYHDGSTSLNGLPGGDCRRSVCLEYLHFNSDSSIRPLVQTAAGVSLPPEK